VDCDDLLARRGREDAAAGEISQEIGVKKEKQQGLREEFTGLLISSTELDSLSPKCEAGSGIHRRKVR
jgi:hypothetical protein